MELDAGRVRNLQVFTEAELGEIGRRSIRVLAEQLDAVDNGLADGNLPAAAEAAHRARNETMLLGARELTEALGALENATRAGQHLLAREAAAAARVLWPSTREAIARATYGVTG